MKKFLAGLATGLFIVGMVGLANATPWSPYDIEAYTTTTQGNAAGSVHPNYLGYFDRPSSNYYDLSYTLGHTNMAGQLFLDFNVALGDGDGDDLSIVTADRSYLLGSSFGSAAKIDFFWGQNLVGTLDTTFSSDTAYYYDLPGENLYVNRVVITNMTPLVDYATNNGGFAFLYAGFDNEALVAASGSSAPSLSYPYHYGPSNYSTPGAPIPEPATMLLFGTGIALLAGSRTRRKKKA